MGLYMELYIVSGLLWAFEVNSLHITGLHIELESETELSFILNIWYSHHAQNQIPIDAILLEQFCLENKGFNDVFTVIIVGINIQCE